MVTFEIWVNWPMTTASLIQAGPQWDCVRVFDIEEGGFMLGYVLDHPEGNYAKEVFDFWMEH